MEASTGQGMPRMAGSHQHVETGKEEFFTRTFGGGIVMLTP